MGEDTSKLLIRVSSRLKGKIAGHVARKERNMNDALVEILAEHYGIVYEATQRRPAQEVGPSPSIMLYLPTDLREAIDLDAAASSMTARDTVVKIISEKLGVKFQPGGRWPAKAAR